jgi:hypothetical protein
MTSREPRRRGRGGGTVPARRCARSVGGSDERVAKSSALPDRAAATVVVTAERELVTCAKKEAVTPWEHWESSCSLGWPRTSSDSLARPCLRSSGVDQACARCPRPEVDAAASRGLWKWEAFSFMVTATSQRSAPGKVLKVYPPSGFRRPRTIQVSTTTVRLNSTRNPPSATAGGAGVMADPVSGADRPRGVRARRRPAWSISPAAVAREPATAGCRLARRSRSGSLLECHRVGRCSVRRARITGRGTTTAGKLDWLLWSVSSMPSIKPSEGEPRNCHCRTMLRQPPTRPLGQADRAPDCRILCCGAQLRVRMALPRTRRLRTASAASPAWLQCPCQPIWGSSSPAATRPAR